MEQDEVSKRRQMVDQLYQAEEYEYVRFIAIRYFPDYADEPMMWDYTMPSLEKLVRNGILDMPEPDAETRTIIGCQYGESLFMDIKNGLVLYPFKREDYDKCIDVQTTLNLMGLDPEKFWHALLFIHYFVEKKNIDIHPTSYSIQDTIRELIAALGDQRSEVWIKCPGKNPMRVSGNAAEVARHILVFGDSAYNKLWHPTYNGRLVDLTHTSPRDVGIRWQIYDEHSALKLLIDHFRTDKEMPRRVKGQNGSRNRDLLISRLIYLTGLTRSKSYLDTVNSLHGVIRRCQVTGRPKVTSL